MAPFASRATGGIGRPISVFMYAHTEYSTNTEQNGWEALDAFSVGHRGLLAHYEISTAALSVGQSRRNEVLWSSWSSCVATW